MKIGAALGFNLIDYPGRIAAVAFTAGCNYTCPACHAAPILNNSALINENDFLAYLDTVKEWVNGVVICGGEPTLQPDLPEFIAKIKDRNFPVKLDTNGNDPEMLARLLAGKFVDYVAMDIKGPLSLWSRISGLAGGEARMQQSMCLVPQFPIYEFRTTIVPVVRAIDDISFLTVAEMADTAKFIIQATGTPGHKYYIQKFIPRKGGLLDPRLEAFPETPPQLLQDIHAEVLKLIPNTQVRG